LNENVTLHIIKVIIAGTILVLLVFANSMMSYSYAAKKNIPVLNQSIFPRPNSSSPPPEILAPLPIPPPGLLGNLKVITKVTGGNKSPSDFTITVSGINPKPGSFTGSSSGTTVTLKPGMYNLSVSSISGYTTTYSSGCSGSIAGVQTIKCTVTNKYGSPPGSTTFLNVITRVDNTSGGTKKPSDFTIAVSGNSPSPSTFAGSSSGTSVGLKSGIYKVTASPIFGYASTYSSGCSGTASGGLVNCTISNKHTPPGPTTFLNVVTKVDNIKGGTKKPSDFTIAVSGNSPKPASFAGSSSGTSVTLQPGKYSVSETSIPGYTTSSSSGCSGTVSGGVPINCTVTNLYTPVLATLVVTSNVDNTNGGTKKPSDFTISVASNNPRPSSFSGSSFGSPVALRPGTYSVTESSVSGYTATYSSGCSGSISAGQTLSCTVTNKYQTSPIGQITVVKNVINDDRGTKKPSDFMIFVTGSNPSPNNFPGSALGTSVSIQPGNYEIVEASMSGYTTTYSSGCSGRITGGERIKCVVINDDIPPTPFVHTETVKLGKSTFVSNALRPLVDVGPSSNIIGGHVSLSSPTGSSSDHLKLIAAEITDAGLQHAVAINLTKILDITPIVQSLYHTDLRSIIAGVNPFTGAPDRVTHFTDLLLWNNGATSIVFSADDYLTTEVSYFAR